MACGISHKDSETKQPYINLYCNHVAGLHSVNFCTFCTDKPVIDGGNGQMRFNWGQISPWMGTFGTPQSFFNWAMHSLTAAGIPASSGHTPIIRCWRSLCQWFESCSNGGLERFRQGNRGFRRQSGMRSWSSVNLPPTPAPCLHKVLLLLGRKSTLEYNIDKSRMALWSLCQLDVPSHLQYIILRGSQKCVATFFVVVVIVVVFALSKHVP